MTDTTHACFRCNGPTIESDQGVCPRCVAMISVRTQERMAVRRRRQARTESKAMRALPLKETPGWIKAERWFATRQDQAKAIAAHPTIQQRCAAYKMSVGQWMVMVAEQKGMCAICGVERHPLLLHIDHDHESGKVRGLLCSPCNTGLGMLRIDGAGAIDRARAVVSYVRRQRTPV